MNEQNNVEDVYDIFKTFFGEEKIDLQEDTAENIQKIIVHFPKVTVTNEYDKSIDITELWVKVKISKEGFIVGTFEMIRSEYTLEQILSGYCHSHVSSVNEFNIDSWKKPCLGTGPIKDTITSLSCNFSKELWELFCYELSKYITVESVSGGPYIRLENVGFKSNNVVTLPFRERAVILNYKTEYAVIKKFIYYIVDKKPFNFNFINNSYGIALSNKELLIVLSNLFIEYYNSLSKKDKESLDTLLFTYILGKGKFINGILYYESNNFSNNAINLLSNENTFILTFKGKDIKLSIIKPENKVDPNIFIFLNPEIVQLIMCRILILINDKYENNITTSSAKEMRRYI